MALRLHFTLAVVSEFSMEITFLPTIKWLTTSQTSQTVQTPTPSMHLHTVLVAATIVLCLLTTSALSRTVSLQTVAGPSQYLVVPSSSSGGDLALDASGDVFLVEPLPGSQSNEVTIIHSSTGMYLQARRQFSGPPLPPGAFIPASALSGVYHFQLSAELTGQSLEDLYSGVWSETGAVSDGSWVSAFYQEIFYVPPVGSPRHTRAHLGYSGKMEPILAGVPPPQWRSVCQGACPVGRTLNEEDCSCACSTLCANGGTQDPDDCSCSCNNICANGGVRNDIDCSCACSNECDTESAPDGGCLCQPVPFMCRQQNGQDFCWPDQGYCLTHYWDGLIKKRSEFALCQLTVPPYWYGCHGMGLAINNCQHFSPENSPNDGAVCNANGVCGSYLFTFVFTEFVCCNVRKDLS
jgi:hypothetical protein